MSAARKKARAILEELGIDRPELLTHLREICCERGAFVRVAKLDSAEARLTVNGERGIITVKPNDNYASRTRFSIAHELGHFELHRGSVTCDTRALNEWEIKRSANNREEEANEFASELLMPESFIRADIESNQPSIAFLERLAERYQTSLFATTRRFIDLTKEACAAVFFREDRVLYAWRSSLFAQQRYKLVDRLSPYSYAQDALSGESTPNNMSDVDASIWLIVPGWLEGETILEQARFFPGLGLGMSLLWIGRSRLIAH